ncbi:hypothetical protein [Magnetospira sp. QH-2]|nr:hypothetical protein [Magnetospira sp. QH-2]
MTSGIIVTQAAQQNPFYGHLRPTRQRRLMKILVETWSALISKS